MGEDQSGPRDSRAGAEGSRTLMPDSAYVAGGDVDLIEIGIALAKRKWFVLGLPILACVGSVIVSLAMSDLYTATARILPPQQNQSAVAAAVLGSLGPLSGNAGAALGLKNPSDLYVGMLQSRTVSDALISRFGLQSRYEKATMVETRQAFRKITEIKIGKDGLIAVSVDDTDPAMAARLANAYVDELDKLTQDLAITDAGQRRLFLEKQLKLAKDNLVEAEVALKRTQEETGLIRMDEQGRALIEAVANLRAQIAAKEVALRGMRAFATDSNPSYVRTRQELEGLRAELAKLEGTSVGKSGDIFLPTDRVPQASLEYVRKLREVKYFETLFELLARQYEVARADEARESSNIQIVDEAVPPDRKSKPKRTLIVLIVTLLAGVLSIVVAFIFEAIERVGIDPREKERVQMFLRYLRK